MPQSPKRITPPVAGKSSGRPRWDKARDKESAAFYASYRWRKFRKQAKQQQRRHDEKIVHDLYESSPPTTFRAYTDWLASDAPLCVHCAEDGQIRQAVVADHPIRIKDGGAKLNTSNIQWLCQHHHSKKSGSETHA